jgi:hypothetical protein
MVESYIVERKVPASKEVVMERVRHGDLSVILEQYELDIKRPISAALTGICT